MAENGKLPVMDSVKAAFAFFTENWTRFAPPAALAALGIFVFLQAAAAPGAGRLLIGMAAAFFTSVAYRAALFRFALRGEYDGLFGMRLSAEEGRVAGVGALYAAFMFLVALVAMVPVLLVVMSIAASTGDLAAVEAAAGDSAATMEALGGPARVAYAIGGIFVLCLLAFVAVRLCLVVPATVAEGRIVFLKSWPWTKDSFWRLLAAIVLAAAPGFLAEWTLLGLATGALEAGQAGIAGVLTFAGAFAWVLIGGMMSAGLLAFLYRGLRPQDGAAG